MSAYDDRWCRSCEEKRPHGWPGFCEFECETCFATLSLLDEDMPHPPGVPKPDTDA